FPSGDVATYRVWSTFSASASASSSAASKKSDDEPLASTLKTLPSCPVPTNTFFLLSTTADQISAWSESKTESNLGDRDSWPSALKDKPLSVPLEKSANESVLQKVGLTPKLRKGSPKTAQTRTIATKLLCRIMQAPSRLGA